MACGLFFREQRPRVAQGMDVEELQPKEHRLEGTFGNGQFVAHVEDVVLDLALTELIR